MSLGNVLRSSRDFCQILCKRRVRFRRLFQQEASITWCNLFCHRIRCPKEAENYHIHHMTSWTAKQALWGSDHVMWCWPAKICGSKLHRVLLITWWILVGHCYHLSKQSQQTKNFWGYQVCLHGQHPSRKSIWDSFCISMQTYRWQEAVGKVCAPADSEEQRTNSAKTGRTQAEQIWRI